MRYDLNDPREYLEATKRLQEFAARGAAVELHPWKKPKTNRQNNYLHFLCRYFAAMTGYTFSEAKEVYLKRHAAPHVFAETKVNKLGETIVSYRSISDLSVAECTAAISNFIEYAALGGVELPMPDDKPFVRQAEREVEDAGPWV